MSPIASFLPSRLRRRDVFATRSGLYGLGLAPAAHGASGWLDELAPFIVVLLLLLAYLWWARRAIAAQDQEEPSHENEVAHDGQP